jgi:hypothetical protein
VTDSALRRIARASTTVSFGLTVTGSLVIHSPTCISSPSLVTEAKRLNLDGLAHHKHGDRRIL